MEAAQGSTLATLLVSCPDRRGIVAALAQVLYGHGANILDSDQHTDSVAGLRQQDRRFRLSTARDRVAQTLSLPLRNLRKLRNPGHRLAQLAQRQTG